MQARAMSAAKPCHAKGSGLRSMEGGRENPGEGSRDAAMSLAASSQAAGVGLSGQSWVRLLPLSDGGRAQGMVAISSQSQTLTWHQLCSEKIHFSLLLPRRLWLARLISLKQQLRPAS